MSLNLPYLNDKVFVFPDLLSRYKQGSMAHGPHCRSKKMGHIRWGDYFKIEKADSIDIASTIYQLIYILTPKSRACTFWCCSHAFRFTQMPECLHEEPPLDRTTHGEAFCSLLLLHFLKDSPLSPSFLLFPQRNPVSPYLFMPLHLGLFIQQVGPVIQLWPQPQWVMNTFVFLLSWS